MRLEERSEEHDLEEGSEKDILGRESIRDPEVARGSGCPRSTAWMFLDIYTHKEICERLLITL